jgi:two-component system chemotaxis response regulator CheB
MSNVRILVVDDSAFARKVLREVLQTSPSLEVVGTARDGLDALAKIDELDPDVVTLDLVMPNFDGLQTLGALAGRERPKVVVVCMADVDSELALSALAAGAVDVVHKPTALATERLYELSHELVFKVRAAAAARRVPAQAIEIGARLPTLTTYRGALDILVIGASTGGPQAIERVLKGLPANFPAPVAVVVHLPLAFTESYAERLNNDCALSVVEAYEGVRLRPGQVVIARGGSHLVLKRDAAGIYGSTSNEPISLHRPSVDELFLSAARVAGRRALGVVLTGMGDDGLVGSRALKAAGGELLVEAESTAVVYGMPRVVMEAGLARAQHRVGDIAAAILNIA